MRVRDLGEFGLIGRIARALPPPPSNVIVGIGDDVAVLQGSGPDYLLATCDVQVENVHFRLDTTTPYQLGRKVVAINVSDIAAMGGAPLWGLVSLALPPDTDVSFVDGLYEGMAEEMGRAGGSIVGGNLSKIHSEIVIDLCLMGSVARDKALLRKGAEVGDLVLVTGFLGDSRAGLELLRHPEWTVSEDTRRRAVERHLTPQPRLKEGQILAEIGCVHAMADVSDGLVSDLRHICGASRVGAEIWVKDLPISSACRETAGAAGMDASTWALTGGEDYELLFTAPESMAGKIQEALQNGGGTSCRVIGRTLAGPVDVRVCMPDGRTVTQAEESKGWDHFSGS